VRRHLHAGQARTRIGAAADATVYEVGLPVTLSGWLGGVPGEDEVGGSPETQVASTDAAPTHERVNGGRV
jgi:hypothetical protein